MNVLIQVQDIVTDLIDWNWLYTAGRLQKPVLDIIKPKDESLKDALIENRRNAMRVALLQLPDYFTFEQFFAEVAAISYRGDFRMKIGEDRQKVVYLFGKNTQSLLQLIISFGNPLSRLLYLQF